jgi:hypothetical protein
MHISHTRPEDITQKLFDRKSRPFTVRRVAGQPFSARYPSHELFLYEQGAQPMNAIVDPSNGSLSISSGLGQNDSLPALFDAAWAREMFYFAAERLSIGENAAAYASRLSPNASNLPNVLHTLSGERGDVFQRLVRHLREVFPTIGNLSVRIKPGTSIFEIRVWPTEAMERVELSFPLNTSGTGVAQMIALLTAIIIIDEINSFLHPAAIKALLRILQANYLRHQYIISTHAPDVIGFSNPTTIHLVKRVGYESSVEQLNLSEVNSLSEVAEHLGVSMADVFAADRVIWVEGPTEELCFPHLYQRQEGQLPSGTIFSSVAATGDFNTRKRDRAIVYEVYNRLCTAAVPLVVAVAFSFDAEKLTDVEKFEMQRDSGGRLHFLPRRHIECYLIDPEAIAAFVVSKDAASAQIATPQLVEYALQDAAGKPDFLIDEWNGDLTDEAWLTRVDAAKLIMHVCGSVSEQRALFNKKADTLFLLQHILDHNATKMEPLGQYVVGLVRAVQADSSG